MSTNKLYLVVLAVVSLIMATLACSRPTDGDTSGVAGAGEPSVIISGPPSGTAVTVGEEVNITSVATAGAGVDRVELSVSGLIVRSDAPPSGAPTSFSVVQAWTPETAGDAIVSVVAYDVAGAASQPATIVLQVTAAGAEGTPKSTLAPEPVATSTMVPDVTGGGGCTLNAAYVADVIIPDNTPLTSGEAAVKTWRIRNSGTCDWTTGFNLVFVSGDQMGGEATVAVPATAAGATVELSVHLTAPTAPGTYRGEWRMRSDKGTAFGSVLYVQIVVPGATDVPTKDTVPEPTKDTPAEPTKTSTPTPTEEPPIIEIVAPYASDYSGSVGSDGTVVPYTVSPGDSADSRLFEGFISFDIIAVPPHATILKATLDLGPCTEWGDGGVDQLGIQAYQYGILSASDFNASGDPIGFITPCILNPLDVTESVQAYVWASYYQLRVFPLISDLDSTADHYTFSAPTLTITYTE